MKKIINYAMAILMLVFVGFVGCQKENTFEKIDLVAEAQIKVISYNNGKGTESMMLSFKDMALFKATLQELADKVEKNDTDFNLKYAHLDEEQINKKCVEIGYDLYEPLKRFERNFGFHSALDTYLYEEIEWLNKEELNDNSNPDIRFGFLNEEELVLVNEDLAVMIGGEIFVQKRDGKINIKDGDFESFKRIVSFDFINQIDFSQFDNMDYRLATTYSKSTCRAAHTNNREWKSGKYKMKGKTRFLSNDYWHGTELYVTTKYFKKGWLGYYRYKTSITAAIDGIYSFGLPFPGAEYCGIDNGLMDEDINKKHHNRRSLATYRYEHNPYEVLYVEDNKLKGIHKAGSLDKDQDFFN